MTQNTIDSKGEALLPQTTYKNKRVATDHERFQLNAELNTYLFNNCDHEHDGYPNHLACRPCVLDCFAFIASRAPLAAVEGATLKCRKCGEKADVEFRYAAAASSAPAERPSDLPFDDYCAGGDCRNCKGVNCTCPHHAPNSESLYTTCRRVWVCKRCGNCLDHCKHKDESNFHEDLAMPCSVKTSTEPEGERDV